MSAVISSVLTATRPAAHRATELLVAGPAANRQTRHAFPIGARFPRVTPAMELAHLVESASAVPVVARWPFPIGARFRRRTPAEVAAYVDANTGAHVDAPVGAPVGAYVGAEIADPTSIRVTRPLPVGARFPRPRVI